MTNLLALAERAWSGAISPEQVMELRAALEAATDQVTKADYLAYCATWPALVGGDWSAAGEFERRFPALALQHAAARHVTLEATHLKPPAGLYLWHVYNMGFVVRTAAGTTIGIDLHGPGLLPLAGHLDALLITHEHPDHNTPGLVEEMLRLGRPVVSNFAPGSRLMKDAGTHALGDLKVDVSVGDHFFWKPDAVDNMLMFHLQSADGASVYHIGDNSNVEKLAAGAKDAGAFIFHVQVGLDTPRALAKLTPGLAVGSHLLEMRHDVGIKNYRWPFYYADDQLQTYPPEKRWVPFWGQRRHILPR